MNHDAFHLKPVAQGQAFEPAPGAVVTREFLGLLAAPCLQRRNGRFHLLGLGFMCHQNGVWHGHGDHVLQPDTDDLQPVCLGTQQTVAAVDCQGVVGTDIALGIRAAFQPDGLPAAQIGPAVAVGHDDQVIRLFHDRIINRDVFDPGPGRGTQTGKAQVILGGRQRRRDSRDQIGGKTVIRVDDRLGLEQKYPGIPQEIPLGQHGGGLLGLRFFHETRQWLGPIPVRRRIRGQFQIPIAGFRPRGRNAKSHQLAGLGAGHRRCNRRPKGLAVRDHMIRRCGQYQGLRIGARHPQRRRQNGRGRVAPLGFDQNALRGLFDLRQLFGYDEPEHFAGQQQRRRKPIPRQPPRRGLKQAFVAHQTRELFGVRFTRQGPQPGARAATQKNRGNDWCFHNAILGCFIWQRYG